MDVKVFYIFIPWSSIQKWEAVKHPFCFYFAVHHSAHSFISSCPLSIFFTRFILALSVFMHSLSLLLPFLFLVLHCFPPPSVVELNALSQPEWKNILKILKEAHRMESAGNEGAEAEEALTHEVVWHCQQEGKNKVVKECACLKFSLDWDIPLLLLSGFCLTEMRALVFIPNINEEEKHKHP